MRKHYIVSQKYTGITDQPTDNQFYFPVIRKIPFLFVCWSAEKDHATHYNCAKFSFQLVRYLYYSRRKKGKVLFPFCSLVIIDASAFRFNSLNRFYISCIWFLVYVFHVPDKRTEELQRHLPACKWNGRNGTQNLNVGIRNHSLCAHTCSNHISNSLNL